MPSRAPTSFTCDICLRDVTEGDLPIFFEQQWDSDANRMAAVPPRDRDAFMTHWTKILADRTVPVKTILLDGLVAGNVVSWERDGKRLVGYWIGKNYWGQGVATKALSEFLKIVTARPLYAHVAKHNIASIRVLEKCGFTICPEATETSHATNDGVDELVFRLGASE